MSREPRAPLTADIMRKGEGAAPEPLPVPEAPPPQETIVGMTIRMPQSLAEELRVLAFKTRRGKGELVVDALRRMLRGTAPKASIDSIWPVIRDAIDSRSGDDNPARVARNVVHAMRAAGFEIVFAEVKNG